MADRFLSLARRGKNQWWRYILSLLLVLFSWLIIGNIPSIALIILVFYDSSEQTDFNYQTNQFQGIDPLWIYLVINFAFIAFGIALYAAICFIHQRRFITLITPQNQVKYSRIFQGFFFWLILQSLSSALEYYLLPNSYEFTYNQVRFLIFLPLALVLTPIQTTVEELFFRGYLMQTIGLITRKKFILVSLTSLVFMLLHLPNPEVSSSFLLLAALDLGLAVFLAIITVKDNTLELALGVHAANNLFTVLLVNPSNSALPSDSVFTYELNSLYTLVSFVVTAVIFYIVFYTRIENNRKST